MVGRDYRKIIWALGFWGLWTLATWWLEGRINTFNRPDAMGNRLIYNLVANILIGVVGASFFLRSLPRADAIAIRWSGFGSGLRTAIGVPIGFALGLTLYFWQGAPATDPVVILNAYCQVLVVSIAEIVVCWSLVGGMIALTINSSWWKAAPVAALVASILFGVYHFAHSSPFNTIQMVVFLSVIGLVTSAFFFVSMNVYATICFHNFLGMYGVVKALAANDQLETFQSLELPLIVTAVISFLVLIAADHFIVRSSP